MKQETTSVSLFAGVLSRAGLVRETPFRSVRASLRKPFISLFRTLGGRLGDPSDHGGAARCVGVIRVFGLDVPRLGRKEQRRATGKPIDELSRRAPRRTPRHPHTSLGGEEQIFVHSCRDIPRSEVLANPSRDVI